MSAPDGRGTVCCRPCTMCEGMEHHWMPDVDDDSGEPFMVCKHCPATREYDEEDDGE